MTTTDTHNPMLDWLVPVEPARLGEMTEEAYAAEPGVRSSLLREVDRSPFHAWRAMTAPRETTDAMMVGQMLHAGLLEWPHGLSRFAVSKTHKTLKAVTKHCTGVAPGKIPVPEALAEKASAEAAAVMAHPEASELLSGEGSNEQVFLWTDPLTGIACKCRVDRLKERREGGSKRLRVADVKRTSKGCGARQFAKTVQEYGYDLSAAHYLAGLEAWYETRVPWYWIVVEEDTLAVAVHRADPGLIEWADGRRQRLLATLADSIKTCRWDMPAGSVIERPRWAKE